MVEVHDTFNNLLPIGLSDLCLVDPDDAIEALVGDLQGPVISPLNNPVTGPRGRIPTNLSGGLKARGHPVGGTGLFQICENYFQLTGAFPNTAAQVPDAQIALSHSIGGPGNNNYVTILERNDHLRVRDDVAPPPHVFGAGVRPPEVRIEAGLDGVTATVKAATTIHVTGSGSSPIHVALLDIAGRRVFARLDHAAEEGEAPEQALAGSRVKLLVKGDRDAYFQIPRGRGIDFGATLSAIRKRVGY